MDLNLYKPYSRARNGDKDAPYAMSGARQEEYGFIRALKRGSASPDAVYGRPLARWNDHLLQTDLRRSTGTDEGTLYGAVQNGDRLYASMETAAGRPQISVFPTDFDAAAWDIVTWPPRISAASYVGVAEVGPVAENHVYTGYLFIPINSRGEAGAWHYAEGNGQPQELATITVDAETSYVIYVKQKRTWTLAVSEECDHVAVYQTLDMFFTGFPLLHSGDNTDGFPYGADQAFRFIGNVGATDGVVEYTDTTILISDQARALLGPDEPKERMKIEANDALLDRDRTHNSALQTFVSRTASGRRVLQDGPRTLYGDVRYPTRPVRALLEGTSGEVPGPSPQSVRVQREYRVGDTWFFGPDRVYGDCCSLVIPWEGETRLALYVLDGGTYKLYERLTPNAQGVYVSSYLEDGKREALPLTFNGNAYDASRLNDTVTIGAHTDYVDEPSTVLLSATNRPWEVTLDAFQMPDDNPVRLLAPLTTAQAEAVRSYDFLSATEENVYLHTRTEGEFGPVVAADTLLAGTGVLLDAFSQPVYAACKAFGVMAGTDHRLYRLYNGGWDQLDEDVMEMGDDLWATVHGLAYHADDDELYVLTDTGIHLYDFKSRGFVGTYPYEFGTGDGECDVVWYDGDARSVLARIHGVTPGTAADLLDESGAAFVPSVTTQRLTEGRKARCVHFEADFDEAVIDTFPGRMTVRYAVRHPVVNQVDEDDPLKATIEFTAEPNRKRQPRSVAGVGAQFKLTGFEELRRVRADFEAEP